MGKEMNDGGGGETYIVLCINILSAMKFSCIQTAVPWA